MEVVSEKTGYPIETLEPAMDMESDLGIDSIKRVEILGAMQTSYPDLPKLKPEELPNCVPSVRSLSISAENLAHRILHQQLRTCSCSSCACCSETNHSSPAPVAVVTSSVDLAELTQTLMEVVSEKTGYPIETLEPAMDMESDLGIDSIKRVEILGAMQTRYPDLAQTQTGRTR